MKTSTINPDFSDKHRKENDMKFKEIKPGMVIHCPKEEDARALLKHLDDVGYIWEDTFDRLLDNTRYKEGDTYFLNYNDNDYRVAHDSYDWAIKNGYTPIEFSDLIEPDDSPIDSPTDSPMTAVEVLEWLDEYATKEDVLEELFPHSPTATDIIANYLPETIVENYVV